MKMGTVPPFWKLWQSLQGCPEEEWVMTAIVQLHIRNDSGIQHYLGQGKEHVQSVPLSGGN